MCGAQWRWVRLPRKSSQHVNSQLVENADDSWFLISRPDAPGDAVSLGLSD